MIVWPMCALPAFNSLLWVDHTIHYRWGSVSSGEGREPVPSSKLQTRGTAQPLNLLNHTTTFSTPSILRGTCVSPRSREVLPPRIQPTTWGCKAAKRPREAAGHQGSTRRPRLLRRARELGGVPRPEAPPPWRALRPRPHCARPWRRESAARGRGGLRPARWAPTLRSFPLRHPG